MCHKLARDLGLTVEDLLNKITVREFASWLAFYKMERDEANKAQRRS